jgi:hypothetical protein
MSALKTALISAGVVTAGAVTRQWWRRWGVDPVEARMALPGDDLVAEPEAVDTRGITIAAAPHEIWPWLVQMGYGRAGWYSYDTIDMNRPSVDRIVPEWQSLAVGDVVPTHPSGGFVVKVLEPGRCLVLYNDTATLAAQEAEAAEGGAERGTEPTPGNLKAAGTFLQGAGPDFAASWAFVLEEVPRAPGWSSGSAPEWLAARRRGCYSRCWASGCS